MNAHNTSSKYSERLKKSPLQIWPLELTCSEAWFRILVIWWVVAPCVQVVLCAVQELGLVTTAGL